MSSITTKTRTRASKKSRLAVGLAVAAAGLGIGVPAADAGVHTYCSGCVIQGATGIQDPAPFYLTLSYVHYLGTGDRYLAASASGFGVEYGYNTATHGFDGSHYTYAQAANASGYSQVTVNAHSDY